jgi:8-oxo-dGTP diphosphatase
MGTSNYNAYYMDYLYGPIEQRNYFDSQGHCHNLRSKDTISWRISAYALVRELDAILLVMQEDGSHYELPGGGIEIGESVESGVRRECQEETGCDIQVTSTIPFYVSESNFFHDRDGFFHSICLFYEATLKKGSLDVWLEGSRRHSEIRDVRWVPANEVESLVRHRMHHKAIMQWTAASRRVA